MSNFVIYMIGPVVILTTLIIRKIEGKEERSGGYPL